MSRFIQLTLLGTIVATVSIGPLQCQEVCNAKEPQSSGQHDEIEPSNETQQIARLIAANELMRLHWTEWVTGKELKEIAKTTAKGINEQLDNRWEAKFLVPRLHVTGQRLNELEKQGIVDIRAGVPEVWRKTRDGLHYTRGMRAATACLQCHRPLGQPALKLEEGDLLGVISLTLKH